MTKVQKTYTQEFKREAVHLAQTSGKPIAQVARELGISDMSIHQWRKDLAEHVQAAYHANRGVYVGPRVHIECYYNRLRRHSSLEYVSPVAFEQLNSYPNVWGLHKSGSISLIDWSSFLVPSYLLEVVPTR
jgi:transposase InsO family protein